MELRNLRNIGIAAHIDAGKTTLSERILVVTGKERRVGRVDDGTATLDWMDEERERGITISSAATWVEWKDGVIQLIDTPGHVDFTIEVERCMRVLDGGILVLDAIEAVQAQTDTVWQQMAERGLPALGFVNKCERAGADFLGVVDRVRSRLGIRAVVVQYPVEVDGKLVGIADLLARTFASVEGGQEQVGQPLPEVAREEVEVLRMELIEALAEDAEELVEAAVSGEDPGIDVLHAALKKAVQERRVLPLYAGSALQGLGVSALLDGVLRYLPSPLERSAVTGFDPSEPESLVRRGPSVAEPFCALAFKIQSDEEGDSVFARVYSGQIELGSQVFNPRTGVMYPVREIRRMHADHFECIPVAGPGHIVALRGLDAVATGDTLCSPAEPVALESFAISEPVIARILEPQSTEDYERLRLALQKLTHEDLALRARELGGSGQFIIEGMGSLHLEIQVARLRRQFGVEPRVGDPQVSYRECLLGAAEGTGEVCVEVGGQEVFGRVRLELDGGGLAKPVVEWAAHGTVVPELEDALLEGLQAGPQLGYPLLGVTIKVLDVDQGGAKGPQGLVLAGQKALDVCLGILGAKGQLGWLEPMMRVDLQVPEEFRGGVLADLGARGADIDLVQSSPGRCHIKGVVPLAQVFDYSTEVRSLSQGRASFAMQPAGHRLVSAAVLAGRGLVL